MYSHANGLAPAGAPNGAGAAAVPLAIVVVVGAVDPNKPPPVPVARQKNSQFCIDRYFNRPPNVPVAVGAPNAVDVGAAAPKIDGLGAVDVEPNKPAPAFAAENMSC